MSAKKTFARQLRRTKTVPERKLWRELRALNSCGFHFRQQVPIGKYFADFAEFTSRLVLEVDGDDHAVPVALERDAERTRWLEDEGFRVLRFSNRDVLQNLPGVLVAIRDSLADRVFPLSSIENEKGIACQATFGGATPTPNPSPQGGGERAHTPRQST